jgi:hypothetical protein
MAAANLFKNRSAANYPPLLLFKLSPTNRRFNSSFIGNFPPFTGSLLCFA